tara:strand:+ start:232 stop:558 length:327 start_codon:yes stop_codon:yes gene_type:complete
MARAQKAADPMPPWHECCQMPGGRQFKANDGRRPGEIRGTYTGKKDGKFSTLLPPNACVTITYNHRESGKGTGKMSGELANVASMEPMYPDARPEFEDVVLELSFASE